MVTLKTWQPSKWDLLLSLNEATSGGLLEYPPVRHSCKPGDARVQSLWATANADPFLPFIASRINYLFPGPDCRSQCGSCPVQGSGAGCNRKGVPHFHGSAGQIVIYMYVDCRQWCGWVGARQGSFDNPLMGATLPTFSPNLPDRKGKRFRDWIKLQILTEFKPNEEVVEVGNRVVAFHFSHGVRAVVANCA